MGRQRTLNLSAAEADALDRLLDAFLATEERWEIVPHLRSIRDKLATPPLGAADSTWAADSADVRRAEAELEQMMRRRFGPAWRVLVDEPLVLPEVVTERLGAPDA